MPLRFDQPKLLGEWEGDPTVIHQALAKMGENGDMLANGLRENRKLDIEKKAKKPTFKISNTESPFSKDTDEIAKNVNTMLDPSVDDNTKAHLDQKNQYIASKGKSQEKQLTGLQQNLTPLLQKWGKNADFSKFNELENKIRTEDDITTRDKNLSEFGALQSRPEDYVNGDGLVIDFHKNMKETPLTYKEDIEKGGRTESKDFTITTKYPTKGEPLLNPDGSQVVIDGNPQFKSREPRSPQELLPYADDLLNSDKDVKRVIYTQTYRKNKDAIDNNTKSWAKSMELSGQKPTEEEMQSYMDGQTEKLAKESVATTLFNNDRARIEGARKVSFEKPTESDIAKSQNKANLKKAGGSTTRVANVVFTDGADERKYYSTSKGGNMDFSTKGAIAVQQQEKNGTFKPTPYLSQSIQGDVWNLTNGGKMNIGGNENIQIDEFVPFIEIQGKNGQWIRRDVAPAEDIESVVKSSTQPVRVVTAAVGKVVPKGNKEMTLTGDDLALLEKLKASKFDDLSQEQKDRYGELSAMQKGEGNTIMFDAIKSNALKKVTGYSDMYDIYNDKNTEQNIKNKAKVHIDLEKLANETNTKNGFDKAKIDQQTRSGEENTIRQKRTVELYNQYKKLEDPEEKKAFIKANGIPLIDGKLDFNKATGKPTVEQPKPAVTRVKGVAVPMAKPKVTTIKKADIAAKAKAAGYSITEYTELLRGNGITIK